MAWTDTTTGKTLYDSVDLKGEVTEHEVHPLVAREVGVGYARVTVTMQDRRVFVDIKDITATENEKLKAYLFRMLPASWSYSVNVPGEGGREDSMSTNEERIKQRFRTLADGAPLGPDRQYLHRACELLIEAMVPELNRMDRAVDAHEDRLSKPTTMAATEGKRERKWKRDELCKLITSDRWQREWPGNEKAPVEFGGDGQVLWEHGDQLSGFLYTTNEAFLCESFPFISVFRQPGVLAMNPRNDLPLTSQSLELLTSQLKFGPWGYPLAGVMYERFHVETKKVIQSPVCVLEETTGFFCARGSFNEGDAKGWPPGARNQALDAVLPKRCLVLGHDGQCLLARGHSGQHDADARVTR